jgi:hypothetical protein
MNAANDTTNAINHGFALGIQVDRDSELPEVELAGLWVPSWSVAIKLRTPFVAAEVR